MQGEGERSPGLPGSDCDVLVLLGGDSVVTKAQSGSNHFSGFLCQRRMDFSSVKPRFECAQPCEAAALRTKQVSAP